MESWGNNGYGTGGYAEAPSWNGPAELNLANVVPNAVQGMTVTVSSDNTVSMHWIASEHATWYNVWLGTAPSEWSARAYIWALAEDLGCENGGTCTLTADTKFIDLGDANFNLSSGEYIFYVQSWGPSGFNTGGIDGTSWVESNVFSIP